MPDLDRRITTILTAIVVMLMATVGIIVISVALTACKPVEPEHPPTYNPTSCIEACNNAERLCGPGALKPKTGTCNDVCKATESGGGDFRTGCISAAATCADVDRCSR